MIWSKLKPELEELVRAEPAADSTTAQETKLPGGELGNLRQPVQIVVVKPDYSQTRCPQCGGETKCKRTYYNHPQDINLEHPTILQVYREVRECLDPACQGRIAPEVDFVDKRGRFTKRAKQKAIVSVMEDEMPISLVSERMWRDFHVRVSQSSVYEWIQAEAEADLGETEYDQWVVARFSGVIGIDEVHEQDEQGQKQYLIVAVDPINDRTILFDLLDSADSAALVGFLRKLAALGIDPQVVITDMWEAYQTAIAQVFPEAAHQLCVFHVIKNVMKHTYQAMLAYRRDLPADTDRQKAIKKELWDWRYLLLKASPKLSAKQREQVEELLRTHQGSVLAEAYYCKEAILALFRESQTKAGARARRDMILQRFGHVPELSKVLNLLRGDTFEQMIIYLDYENLDKTNNNAERTNRTYRKGEKARYRARRGRTRLNYVKLQARRRNRRRADRNERLKPRMKLAVAEAKCVDELADQTAKQLVTA